MDDTERSYKSSNKAGSFSKNGLHSIRKYDDASNLDKYREVQRRTKLLYGVKDIKRMIEKSPDSVALFKEQIDKENDDSMDQSMTKDNETDNPKRTDIKDKFSLKKLLVIDNFIISQNSVWKIVFDNLLLIVIGYTCLTTVLFVSFQLEQNSYLIIFDYGVTIAFALDFVFNFF